MFVNHFVVRSFMMMAKGDSQIEDALILCLDLTNGASMSASLSEDPRKRGVSGAIEILK